jgi:DNA modification methylase
VNKILRQLIQEFNATLGVHWEPPVDLAEAARAAIVGCGTELQARKDRRRRLLAAINEKFRLNQDRFQYLLDLAAARQVPVDYHEKAALQGYLAQGDAKRLQGWLRSHGLPGPAASQCQPLTAAETLQRFAAQLQAPTVHRRDARSLALAERLQQILRSLFGSYVFSSYPTRAMHAYFNPDCRREYDPDFFQHLARCYPSVLRRDCALAFLIVDDALSSTEKGVPLRDRLCRFLHDMYGCLANHCFLAILIKLRPADDEDGQWQLFSDLILYAEKHREAALKIGYFHPEKIAQATLAHIPHLDQAAARFDLANEGFFYRDCFVLPPAPEAAGIQTTWEPVNLLLLLEKNERDETLLPCPACRSLHVAGNSYPVLGVRSWECRNPICPERSAFDRGNRYSLAQLIKQEAIKSDRDQIPEASLRRWKLDVVPGADTEAVVTMLLRHFTLHGDTALFVNTPHFGQRQLGRRLQYERFPTDGPPGRHETFQRSAFFARFVVDRPVPPKPQFQSLATDVRDVELIQGDCFEVLSQFPAESIDGAVTSPPYYNARHYSVWPNIYCYLHDMYNSARQVYRVLKPGGVYLFNIFDYFDNENILALSAMGKKRMILGAYIINLFHRAGFRLEGNTVWYKGEIEGKRNFNQGNRSPYYQFPFNCWEHILVFRKPGAGPRLHLPQLLAARPVVKMIRGKNVLGHTAPFPSVLPELLIDQLQAGQTVLDPYSGSMTTGRTAFRKGLRSVSVEVHLEYCKLGLKLLQQEVDDFRKEKADKVSLERAPAPKEF